MGLFDVKRLNLIVTSGKQFLNMGMFSAMISMKKDDSGNIILGNLPCKFQILEYNWEGAKYQTITNTKTEEKRNVKSNGKEKRKGRVAGAIIGTVLMPGVGTVIGASLGTGKKETGRTSFSNTGNSNTTTKDIEVKSNATLKFKNLDNGEVFVIGFQCNSKIDAELQNFCIPKSKEDFKEELHQQKSSTELLKEYKELLDMGIITQDEFSEKKKELLNL